eukprot:TRINITY_DN78918_c0_g1_i1.p1 TRINITY_DN78918_c0_g1~~TRINITY_DN78918_c0_g1_i1.p1  ORF type:complete len:607 (+),score=114.94 TRINITY_DN78918_c0_g1_i1:54-1874(+)
MPDSPHHNATGRAENVSLGDDLRAFLREDLQAELLDFQHRIERSLRELGHDLIRRLAQGATPLDVPDPQGSAASKRMDEEVSGVQGCLDKNTADTAAGSRGGPGKAWESSIVSVLPGSVSNVHEAGTPLGSAAPMPEDLEGRGGLHDNPEEASSIRQSKLQTAKTKVMGAVRTTRTFRDEERNAVILAELNHAAQDINSAEPKTMMGFMGRIVERDEFDYVMGALLGLNALAMGLQVELEARGQNVDFFVGVDIFFCMIFTLELALRIAVFRRAFYKVAWNNFDFVIVVAMLVDLFVQREWETQSENHASGGPNIALLKLLKLCRVARLVRMIRLIPALKQMVYLVMASLSSFFWTGVLMLILMYCLAIYFCEQGTDWRRNASTLTTEEVANINTITENWGNIGHSILSLFMALTGGDDWRNLIGILGGDSVVNLLIFIFWIAFATLVLLNLVTGVFVEGAQRILKEDKEKEVIRMAAKLFHSLETGNDSALDFQEFRKQLEEGKLKGYCAAVGISQDDASELFRLLDKRGRGRLLVGDFVDGCLRLRGPARSLDLSSVALSLRELKAKNDEDIHRHERMLEKMMSMLRSLLKQIRESGAEVHPLS